MRYRIPLPDTYTDSNCDKANTSSFMLVSSFKLGPISAQGPVLQLFFFVVFLNQYSYNKSLFA